MERVKRIFAAVRRLAIIIYHFCRIQLDYEKIKKYYILLLIIVFGQFCHAMYPFIFTDVPIINEYWSLPEKTLLTDADGKSIYVDNTEFINEHQLFGVQHKYDPRKDNGSNVLIPEMTVKIAWTPELQKFADASEFRFFYDKPSGSLVALDYFTDEDKSKLNKIVVEPVEQERLKQLQAAAEKQMRELLLRKKTPRELEFIASNIDEWGWQIRSQGIIHHRSYIFEPIRDLEYGKSASEVYCQYGYGMAQFIRLLLKCTGGITYTNFVHVVFPFYLIYLVALLYVVYVITKRWDIVLCVALYFTSVIEAIDFKMLYAYDGMNPIRYFPDSAVVFLFYKYAFGNMKTFRFLVAAILVAALFIIYNNSFGLFLYIAVLIGVLYLCIFDGTRRRANSLLLFGAIIIGFWAYTIGTPGPNIMVKYFLSGILTTGVSSGIPLLLFSFGVAYLLLIKNRGCGENSFGVFLLLYAQQMLLFKVVENNSAAVTSAVVFGWIYFGHLAFNGKFLKFKTPTLLFIAVWLIYSSWHPAITNHYISKSNYYDIINAHKITRLPFSEISIESDIEPKLLEETVDFINLHQPQRMITMFSECDTLFLPAAGKINSIPYSDLLAFVFSEYENEQIVKQFQKNAPEFIFVDNAYNVTPAIDVIHERRLQELVYQTTNIDLRSMSWRSRKKQDFYVIWREISENYQLVERCRLLALYKKKDE
ncbi:MAG: hypothetical protein WCP79_07795 [Bacillota bacterium]